MASEINPLPLSLLNPVTTLTGTLVNGSATISVNSTSQLTVGSYVTDNVATPAIFFAGTIITAINTVDKTITLNVASTVSASGVNLTCLVSSYATDSVYQTVPQFIQDYDAAHGYGLYAFLYSIGNTVDIQINAISRYGTGLGGASDNAYQYAPGWSQIVDINRCPTFALPWLAQFVGVHASTGLTRAQLIDKITNRSGFQRGTIAMLINSLVANINTSATTPLTSNKVIVLEKSKYVGGSNPYQYDEYSMTLLIPSTYFSQYTYTSLNAAAGTNVTYTSLDTFIGSHYSNIINASVTPSPTSGDASYIYAYRPAGVRIYIGGY